MMCAATAGLLGRRAIAVPVYEGNPIVNLSAYYGTAPDSWTTVDDRYTFVKFSSSQADLSFVCGKCVFDGSDRGCYADTLPEDLVSTEMTLEVCMSDFTPTSSDNGIVFALDSGYTLNSDIYDKCKGIRSAGTDGLMASYRGNGQDRPSELIKAFAGMKTIAITNGRSTRTRIAYFVNGVVLASIYASSTYTHKKIPCKFGVGGTGTTPHTGWTSGLRAGIHAVRMHYGILTAAQLLANYQKDAAFYAM